MKHFSQEEKEKQRTESHKSRVEREFCLHNLENREEKENWFKKSCKSRKERDLLSKNLENREEKEKWKYNSPARERKIWVISSQDFLEIEILVNDTVGNDVEIQKSSRVTIQAFRECGFVQSYCNNRSLHLNIYRFKHGLKTIFFQILWYIFA